MPTKGKYGKVIFSPEELQFIIDNFQTMTNEQIAEAIGAKKTIVRMTAYDLGLQRMELEYWTPEQIKFLQDNFRRMGDTELTKHYNATWPKKKGWNKRHMAKKLIQLNLHRNAQDLWIIWENHRQRGSFGKPNPKKVIKPMPKVFITIDSKTRIEVKPGQDAKDVERRYFEVRNLQNQHLKKL